MKKIYVVLIAIALFVCGGITGYVIAVCAGNSAHSADIDITCIDGSMPDENGCCAGEIYTDMGDLGFNCCPPGDGDCYPPIR